MGQLLVAKKTIESSYHRIVGDRRIVPRKSESTGGEKFGRGSNINSFSLIARRLLGLLRVERYVHVVKVNPHQVPRSVLSSKPLSFNGKRWNQTESIDRAGSRNNELRDVDR